MVRVPLLPGVGHFCGARASELGTITNNAPTNPPAIDEGRKLEACDGDSKIKSLLLSTAYILPSSWQLLGWSQPMAMMFPLPWRSWGGWGDFFHLSSKPRQSKIFQNITIFKVDFYQKKKFKHMNNNKVLLYSTGKDIQYPMRNHNGKEYEKENSDIYIYIYAHAHIKRSHFAVQKKLTQHCKSTILQ